MFETQEWFVKASRDALLIRAALSFDSFVALVVADQEFFNSLGEKRTSPVPLRLSTLAVADGDP